MQEDFEDRDYIIIEPLQYHIDDSICSLRLEDTYFKGNMTLSNKASLLISQDSFDQIKNNPNYIEELNNYNIFVYKGNDLRKAP